MISPGVIADSSVWIDFLAARRTRQVEWIRNNQSLRDIRTTDLSLCEVLRGTRTSADFERAHHLLTFFGVDNTGGADLAIKSALNFRELRSRGVTVRATIDCLIAAYCIRNGLSLLHGDRDFDPFELHLGLKVIHPE